MEKPMRFRSRPIVGIGKNKARAFSRTKSNEAEGRDHSNYNNDSGIEHATIKQGNGEHQEGRMTRAPQKKRELKPRIYYRLMQKKRETDARVEEMRQRKFEEETKLRQNRQKGDGSNKMGFYERMMEAQKKRDTRVEEMRKAQTKKYSFSPSIPASPYCKKRSSDHESIFDRLYRTSTASSSAYTTTDTNSSHRSSNTSSTAQMSPRLVALYQDGQRRAKKMPKSQKEEDQRRENQLLKQEDYTFKPRILWKDEIRVDHNRQSGRIGISPRPASVPISDSNEDNLKETSVSQSPPREIVIGVAPHLLLTSTPINSLSSSFIAEAQKAEPWTTPPRPSRIIFPMRPPSILDYYRQTDFAVVSPLRDSASFLHRRSKDTNVTRRPSTRGSNVHESDGKTTVEENSAAYDSEGVISDLKTEYGSI